MDQPDEDGNLDQGPDDGGKGRPGVDPKHRDRHREAQVAAFEKGFIPYIPADRKTMLDATE
jgi:hypothetical protein